MVRICLFLMIGLKFTKELILVELYTCSRSLIEGFLEGLLVEDQTLKYLFVLCGILGIILRKFFVMHEFFN